MIIVVDRATSIRGTIAGKAQWRHVATKSVSLTPSCLVNKRYTGNVFRCFSRANKLFLVSAIRTLLAVSGFYLPVGYKSPEFSILANPSVPRVRYRRKGFPSPDWTALSFHFLLWISGLGIFLFLPFFLSSRLHPKAGNKFFDNDCHLIDLFIFFSMVIVKYQLINYLMSGICK